MKNIVLIILLSLAFCLVEATLTFFLPEKATDWDVWLRYFWTRDKTYDAMFFGFSLLVFWSYKVHENPGAKALCVFLVIVTGGSFIDKVIFDLNQYLLSDIVLIAMGVFLSVIKYRKWKILKAG